MLALIRIRVKYIIRHPCLLFWSYLFLPIVIIIAAIVIITKKDSYSLKTSNSVSLIKSEFFQEAQGYPNIKRDFNFTGFLVDNKADCDKITKVLEDFDLCTYQCPKCTDTESNFDNYTLNIIKIEKKNGKYDIELTSRQTSIWLNVTRFLFVENDLAQDIIIDPYTNEDYNNSSKKMIQFGKFFELESIIARILLNLKGEDYKTPAHNFNMTLGYNKYPDSYKFTDIGKLSFPSSMISFIITLQFSLITYNINMRMIDEKEAKLNILLERQGISKFIYMLSWLFTFLTLFLFSIISMILLLFGMINGHIYLFIINIILFSLALYSVCVLFTTCIKTTKTGSTAIKFYNFGSLFLGFAIVLTGTLKVTKIIFGFIPQINFFMNFWCTYCLGNFKNVTGDLLLIRTSKMSYIESIIMYIVEIIFYLGLAIFIQSYKDSGLTFFQYIKSFCKKVDRNVIININNQEKQDLNEKNFEKHFQELSEINKQKLEQNQCLKLVNVCKSFDELKAVDSFNGELFSNEIFCLLGHNGAGKSTTINMISGIFDPDQGDILLDGRSLVTDKKYLYQNIGLCQQEDIFFDYLTVEEHLEYMCKIKGSRVNYQEIDELIRKIELYPKKNALCSTLSGGQKRKLCIALALIGNSKIILLDEPTSGMDVMARRSLWEFLKNYKKDKIILLTTHFLDEAEYLGDRIGIMTDGQYICCGSSSYLKSKYPCGFNINLLINSKIFNDNYKTQLYNELLRYEPKAEIKVASKGIFSVNIQSNNQYIKEIFDYIEKSKGQFGIEDYTVGSTSLEDVFLKINNKSNLNDQKYSKKESSLIPGNKIIPRTSGFCTQFSAQIRRNLYPLYRNKTLFFFELLSGLGFVYIFIFFFADLLLGAMTTTLDLVEVLGANKIYIHTQNLNKKFFEKSDVYDRYGTYISLSEIKEDSNDIKNFMQLAYEKSKAHIAKGAIYVNKLPDNYYEVYNTETNNGKYGYLYANTMLFVSAFLKESYNIDASILHKIIYKASSGDASKLTDLLSDFFVLIIVCLINFIGFIIFLGGLMLEKIKEKRTNIKHLLYLSGNNIFSYWLGYYISDYLKLLVFTILLIAPVYYVNGCATFFGLDMLVVNISTLSFIYFITFFCSKDDDGAKILFIFVFGFLIIVALLAIILEDKILDLIDVKKPYFISILDITPVTSMVYSFIRLIISYTVIKVMEDLSDGKIKIEENMGFKRPEIYLYSNYLAQLMNIALYSILLIIAESGLLGRIIHNFHQCCYADKDVNTPLIAPPQDNNINDKADIQSPLIQSSDISTNTNNIINNQNVINTNIIPLQPIQYNPNQNPIIQNNQTQNYPQPQQNLEFNFNGKNLSGNPLLNPYVQSEIRKVHSQQELSTRIINITKTFYPCCACCRKGKVRAINHLHLGLEPNEKFGLLGFNGSGKTTTFRTITNEILVDCGSINLFGYDTKKQFNHIRTIVGYCPQINPLFDFMKVREIIQFYSKLKTCNESPEEVCEKFGLSKYLNSYTVNLSGGNKRKLTFAIAMMNRPSLLLLDEPSTGVDPESRRIMWKNINELSNSGHQYNMILTTHSMEEAEILCDTVSWFRAGNFITLGNPEELKLKYSAGYKLHIKFNEIEIQAQNKETGYLEKYVNDISSIVSGFNNYANNILQNQFFEPYLSALLNILQKIRPMTKKISLYLIGRDYSFELVIEIINEMKKELFTELLNLKNIDKTVDELTITMQSLENILTSI